MELFKSEWTRSEWSAAKRHSIATIPIWPDVASSNRDLTFEQFENLVNDIIPTEKAKPLFEKYDENKDGKLDFVEYMKGRYQDKWELPLDEVKAIAEYDQMTLYLKRAELGLV